MSKPLGIAVLAAGLILLAYGAQFSDSINGGFARVLAGAATDRTFWFFVGGMVVTILGGMMVFLPLRKNGPQN